MESNLPYYNLPFVDSDLKAQDPVYDVLSTPLSSHSALLASDEVLAQFLSGDEPLEEPDLNGPTTLHCEICRKQFDNAKKYYGHLRVHSKDNLWICDKCPNQKFATKQQLMKHSLTHKPLELIWKCPHCAMAFEALWKLQQHLFHKHLDYRPYKCDECEKAYYKPSDLKKHKDAVHSDMKKYQCSLCEQRFKDKSNMKRHEQRHTKEKAYCCPGCRNRFTQLASLRRHTQKCPLIKFPTEPADKTVRQHHCRVCGHSFQYKSALLEHCVRAHTNNPPEFEKEDANQTSDAKCIVDNIVDDILSAEDDYMTMPTQNEILNVYNQSEMDTDNLMQIELLKDMNQFQLPYQILDEELLYNDIDFDSIQPSHIFNTNTNDMDYPQDKNGEILFDFTDGNTDQDIMNALCHMKSDLPDDLLNPDALISKDSDLAPVSVNDCATIFESDVDLEASTNLAANLNQLIGENRVQYISTEHDDTFIISLNSEIDAEKLTDMLNIGVELANNKMPEDNLLETEDISKELPFTKNELVTEPKLNSIEPIVMKIEEIHKPEVEKSDVVKETKPKAKKQLKLYVCRTCSKVFSKKDNYNSHRATHDPSLRFHKCSICSERFSYRSTLNKHMQKCHTPAVLPAHYCSMCSKTYSQAWLLKNHIARDHDGLTPFACDHNGCDKKFYKKCDLVVHKRHHTNDRPYKCSLCSRAFQHVSHLRRHNKSNICQKTDGKRKTQPIKKRPETTTVLLTSLLITPGHSRNEPRTPCEQSTKMQCQ